MLKRIFVSTAAAALLLGAASARAEPKREHGPAEGATAERPCRCCEGAPQHHSTRAGREATPGSERERSATPRGAEDVDPSVRNPSFGG